jgi:hypothetical protein
VSVLKEVGKMRWMKQIIVTKATYRLYTRNWFEVIGLLLPKSIVQCNLFDKTRRIAYSVFLETGSSAIRASWIDLRFRPSRRDGT